MIEGKVVPFRSRPEPIVWSDGRVQTECDELVHLFARVPGPCGCGQEFFWAAEDRDLIEQPEQPGE